MLNRGYLLSYKKWVFIAIFLFGIGMGFGLATPLSIVNLMSEEIAALEELSRILAPFSVLTVILIFIKNVSALVLSFVLSPILCLVPILALTVNGWLLAFISSAVVQEKSLGFVLAGLLPHGIFELPALIMGQAAALSFGTMAVILILKRESRTVLVSTVRRNVGHVLLALVLFFIVGIFHTIIIVALLEKQTRDLLMLNLNQNLRYLMIALALLLPAAIIETYITPLLLT